MKKIEKKILPEYFRTVKRKEKTFELRIYDEDYCVGDILVLREWDAETHEYTGNKVMREITYILKDVPYYGLKEGWCILAIQPIGWNNPLLYASKLQGGDYDGDQETRDD